MISLPGFRKQATNGKHQHKNGSADSSGNGAPRYDAAALEALVQRAERASEGLRMLESATERGEQFAAMEKRIADLEGQIAAAEAVSTELDTIRSRSQEQAAAQERGNLAIANAEAEAERIFSAVAEVAGQIESVLALRDQMERVPELNAQFAAMNEEASSVRSQVRDLVENISRLRTVHDDVLRAHKHATIRLDGLDQRHQTSVNKMDALERRAESADEALGTLLRLAGGIPDVQHHLSVLKATADQVFHKTAAIEAQREMVERALGQASEVATLNAQLAAAFRGQEDQSRALNAVEGKLTDVQALHETVLSRSAEISAQQQRIEEAERDATRELINLRKEMTASTDRFELENRSLDAASERIAELRGFVKDCENRVEALDSTVQAVTETEARTLSLATQVGHLAEDVNRISTQAERLRVVRDDVGALDDRLGELGERMERVERMRPAVDEVTRELAGLDGAREAVHDGLEQVRLASAEMARMRESHSETSTWLADADP
jgi:chromosome segregation ATPase